MTEEQDRKIRKFANDHCDQILDLVEADDCFGLCVNCGDEIQGVEPDAREYFCENCETPTIYGVEELLFYMSL